MLKAKWGIDYDYQKDKCFGSPVCSVCEEPLIFDRSCAKYRCVSCGQPCEVDEKMQEWLEKRSETKVENTNCFRCGAIKAFETHYMRNKYDLSWRVAFGHCTKCGMRIIV